MAPAKKSKKDANSINSKLNLVMKSGKVSPSLILAQLTSNPHKGYSGMEEHTQINAIRKGKTSLVGDIKSHLPSVSLMRGKDRCEYTRSSKE